MMTPTRIVRFLGFVGLAAFIGLVATSTPTIHAQNDDRVPPPPPPIAADPSKPVIVSQATDEPAPAPRPAVPAIEPLPLPEAADAQTAPVELGEKIKDLPAVAKNPEAAPIPRAPEPKGLEAAGLDSTPLDAEPQPIADAAPAKAPIVIPGTVVLALPNQPAPEQAPIASDDPDSQARSFVERNRKEAEAQLKALNTEAAQLRARLSKIESGIRRWEALADAMEKSEAAALSSAPDEELEPLPRGKATFRSRQKAAVIQSTPDEPVTRAEFVPAPQPR